MKINQKIHAIVAGNAGRYRAVSSFRQASYMRFIFESIA